MTLPPVYTKLLLGRDLPRGVTEVVGPDVFHQWVITDMRLFVISLGIDSELVFRMVDTSGVVIWDLQSPWLVRGFTYSWQGRQVVESGTLTAPALTFELNGEMSIRVTGFELTVS